MCIYRVPSMCRKPSEILQAISLIRIKPLRGGVLPILQIRKVKIAKLLKATDLASGRSRLCILAHSRYLINTC